MREQAEARGIKTLVFSGGVMHNRLLSARLAFYLRDFTLLFPQRLPAGDGGLSLGQGVIAAARVLTQNKKPRDWRGKKNMSGHTDKWQRTSMCVRLINQ